jgi:hypothetical protein
LDAYGVTVLAIATAAVAMSMFVDPVPLIVPEPFAAVPTWTRMRGVVVAAPDPK